MLLGTMVQVEDKLHVLEIVNDYVVEIQQARRFEKNYFLYGTNLSDALENVYKARGIFDRNKEELGSMLVKDGRSIVPPNMNLYESLLKQLAELERKRQTGLEDPNRQKEIELELRKVGQQLVSFAQDLMNREKSAVAKALSRSRAIHIYSLVFLLIFIVFYSYLLGTRILSSIDRFTVYARRIASGDFTPITPSRSFRDEFTELAVAINHMIQELESREAVLIQSHKMRAVGTLTAGWPMS